MKYSFCWAALCWLSVTPVQASHLSEAEVVTLEQACEVARERKLQPEKAALLQQCLAERELDRAVCEQRAGEYGERTTGAIRRLGKYYDLPECEKAYAARKHYRLNPGY